ncbi:MAG: glycosyl hydrolase [Bacteroidota bacterium]
MTKKFIISALPFIFGLFLLLLSIQRLYSQSDGNATCQTQSLYQQLKNLSSDQLLFGHQNSTFEGIGWEDKSGLKDRSDCLEAVGDFPAIHGFDFIRGFFFKQHVIRAYERGGIITFSDHMDNFWNGRDSWNTQGNTVKEILKENSATQKRFINHLTKVANFFKSLKDENGALIPVIYRPFHENSGDWFWWSQPYCTAEEFVELWRFTVDYLRNQREVHNLLYAYSPSDPAFSGGYEAHYPGNQYVDIVGFDSYATIAYEMFLVANARLVVSFAEAHDKVAALTEFGVNGGIQFANNADWFTQTFLKAIQEDSIARKLAYAHTWRNDRINHHWVPLPDDATHADFVAFYEDDFTLFERDLPDMYDCNLVTTATEYEEYIANKMELKMMPNPASDYLFIKSTKVNPENTFRLSIYNSIGQLIVKDDNFIVNNQILVGHLHQGLYFVHLLDQKEKKQTILPFFKN